MRRFLSLHRFQAVSIIIDAIIIDAFVLRSFLGKPASSCSHHAAMESPYIGIFTRSCVQREARCHTSFAKQHVCFQYFVNCAGFACFIYSKAKAMQCNASSRWRVVFACSLLCSPYPTRPACRERRDETSGGVGALGWPSMQASSVPESKETHASLASKHVCQRNVHLPLRALFLLHAVTSIQRTPASYGLHAAAAASRAQQIRRICCIFCFGANNFLHLNLVTVTV